MDNSDKHNLYINLIYLNFLFLLFPIFPSSLVFIMSCSFHEGLVRKLELASFFARPYYHRQLVQFGHSNRFE